MKSLSAIFITPFKGLKDKPGSILFQLPPRYDFTQERLEPIIQSVDRSFINVIEFRHSGWWNEEVYNILAKNKITFY